MTDRTAGPWAMLVQVDRATKLNRFTNSKRTLRENADGLYRAFQARLRRLRAYLDRMTVS